MAMREALETPGRTAALVTPDRMLAQRVSALLGRWGIEADDSAGRPLSQLPPGTLLLAIASAAAEDLAPVPLLALLKHPLVGGEGEERRDGWTRCALLDLALARPAPGGGLAGLDTHFADKADAERGAGAHPAAIAPICAHSRARRRSLSRFARRLAAAAARRWRAIAHGGGRGRDGGRIARASCRRCPTRRCRSTPRTPVPMLRQLLDGSPRPAALRRPSARVHLGLARSAAAAGRSDDPRRAQRRRWPALPAPDPWLAPKIRANLGLPGLEFRIGLPAHDFASALGRAAGADHPRAARQPFADRRIALVAAAAGDDRRAGARHRGSSGWRCALDDPGRPQPADRPRAAPPRAERPEDFGHRGRPAQGRPIRFLRPGDARPAPRSIRSMPIIARAWKGTAVHKVLEQWLPRTIAIPRSCCPRARALLDERGDPPDAPRPVAAAPDRGDRLDRGAGARQPGGAGGARSRPRSRARAKIAGVTLHGKADRIDRLADGGLAIVDYKTGKAPTQKGGRCRFCAAAGPARADRARPAGSKASRAIPGASNIGR